MEILLEARTPDPSLLTGQDEMPLDALIDLGDDVQLRHLGTEAFYDGSIPSLVTFAVLSAGGTGLLAGAVGGYLARVADRLRESPASPARRVTVKLACGARQVRVEIDTGFDPQALHTLLGSFLEGCGEEAPGESGRMDVRHAFVVDVTSYGRRSEPDKAGVQDRLNALVNEVLRDLGVDRNRALRQERGDGLIVILQQDGELQRRLPLLLQATARHLAADNARHTDRIRLRMATDIGPVGRGATGFTGDMVTDMCRLVEGKPLRDALANDPSVDLVAVVSNVLHGWVIDAGHPGLAAGSFRPVHIEVKELQATAWLTTGTLWL